MVWGVCRRILHNHHDAEDAFQATFLVLVRKAASVKPREMVGNWLYGVARQTALKASATRAKRQTRERQVTDMPETAATEPILLRDLQPVLDQELSRLPDKYRSVVVLCDLEGKTRKEAAGQLRCPEGTVAGRLARARVMLAKRLTRRGVALSGGALAAVLAQQAASAAMPTSAAVSTIKAASLFAAGKAAATGAISVKVAALTEGVMKAMLFTKLKVVSVLLVVAALSGAAGVIYQTQASEPLKARTATEKGTQDKQSAAKKELDELQGEWVLVSLVVHGQPVSLADMKKTTKTCVLRGTHLILPFMRGKGFTVKLDPAKHPKAIDLQPRDNPGGKAFPGIYQVDGSTLKINFRDSGGIETVIPQERPASFAPLRDDIERLTFRRAKEADDKQEGEKRTELADAPAKPGVKAPEKQAEQDNDAKMKPLKIRVYIEKVNAETQTITASCMLLGEIDNVTKPLKFENLRVSENAMLREGGKEIKFKLTGLKLDAGYFLYLKTYEDGLGFEVVGIEKIGVGK